MSVESQSRNAMRARSIKAANVELAGIPGGAKMGPLSRRAKKTYRPHEVPQEFSWNR